MAILLSLSSNATPMSNDQGVRLDRWLFAARFFKTRHLASEATRRNHVIVNQQRAKPGKRVFTGDRVSLRKGPLTYDIEIIDLAEKRLAPALAAALFVGGCASTEPAFVSDGLVAYYPFNGNANDET